MRLVNESQKFILILKGNQGPNRKCPGLYDTPQLYSNNGNTKNLSCTDIENKCMVTKEGRCVWGGVNQQFGSHTHNFIYKIDKLQGPTIYHRELHSTFCNYIGKGGFPAGASGKETTCQCRRHKRCKLDSWVGKIPWRKAWQTTPALLPGVSHRQRSLAGYSPQCRKESVTTEATQHVYGKRI